MPALIVVGSWIAFPAAATAPRATLAVFCSAIAMGVLAMAVLAMVAAAATLLGVVV